MSCWVRLLKDGHLAGHKPVLAALFVVIALDVELHQCSICQVHPLELPKQAVSMHKQIACKPI